MSQPRFDIDSIQEEDSAFLLENQPNAIENPVKQSNQQWPFIFWIYLKTLGLYHSGMWKSNLQIIKYVKCKTKFLTYKIMSFVKSQL